jgi:hypothetical protein
LTKRLPLILPEIAAKIYPAAKEKAEILIFPPVILPILSNLPNLFVFIFKNTLDRRAFLLVVPVFLPDFSRRFELQEITVGCGLMFSRI